MKKTELRYNGWANYPTWYLSLDFVSMIAEMAIDQGEVADIDEYYVQGYIEEVIETPRDGIAAEALEFFLGEVDYRELAEAVKEAAEY